MSVQNALGYENFPIPVGALLPYCSATTPYGYLICDGATYNQSDYPVLFRVLDGVGYGQTSTTFTLPNLVGEFIRGTSVNTGTIDAGTSGGETSTVSLIAGNIPPFSTTTQSGVVFSVTPGGGECITSNGSDFQGQNQTTGNDYALRKNTPSAPTGLTCSITASSYSASYTNASQSALSLTATTAPIPSNYSLVYLIRAFY